MSETCFKTSFEEKELEPKSKKKSTQASIAPIIISKFALLRQLKFGNILEHFVPYWIITTNKAASELNQFFWTFMNETVGLYPLDF